MSTTFETWRDRFERLRANKFFETAVIVIIVVSALLIGAKTYEETNRFRQALLVMDVAITVFFLVEILIRMAAERRLVSMVPELRLLIGALFKSIPRMGYVVLLMFIIFYIYGAIGSFLFESVDETLWGNISVAMLTLFQVATFESWATAVLYPVMEHYPFAWIYFLSFIFLNAFIFLNMMIGIVLDVMQKENLQMELESGQGEAAGLHGLCDDVRRLGEQLSRMETSLEARQGQETVDRRGEA